MDDDDDDIDNDAATTNADDDDDDGDGYLLLMLRSFVIMHLLFHSPKHEAVTKTTTTLDRQSYKTYTTETVVLTD